VGGRKFVERKNGILARRNLISKEEVYKYEEETLHSFPRKDLERIGLCATYYVSSKSGKKK
jgi:hypothetical protein